VHDVQDQARQCVAVEFRHLADGPAREAPGGRGAGGGLLVNVTRGIAAAAAGLTSEREVAEALRKAAAEWAERLPVLP